MKIIYLSIAEQCIFCLGFVVGAWFRGGRKSMELEQHHFGALDRSARANDDMAEQLLSRDDWAYQAELWSCDAEALREVESELRKHCVIVKRKRMCEMDEKMLLNYDRENPF